MVLCGARWQNRVGHHQLQFRAKSGYECSDMLHSPALEIEVRLKPLDGIDFLLLKSHDSAIL